MRPTTTYARSVSQLGTDDSHNTSTRFCTNCAQTSHTAKKCPQPPFCRCRGRAHLRECDKHHPTYALMARTVARLSLTPLSPVLALGPHLLVLTPRQFVLLVVFVFTLPCDLHVPILSLALPPFVHSAECTHRAAAAHRQQTATTTTTQHVSATHARSVLCVCVSSCLSCCYCCCASLLCLLSPLTTESHLYLVCFPYPFAAKHSSMQ